MGLPTMVVVSRTKRITFDPDELIAAYPKEHQEMLESGRTELDFIKECVENLFAIDPKGLLAESEYEEDFEFYG